MTGEDKRPPDFGITPRLVLGLTIMTAGLLLALDNLGFVDSSLFFRYWPIAFVIAGTALLAIGHYLVARPWRARSAGR